MNTFEYLYFDALVKESPRLFNLLRLNEHMEGTKNLTIPKPVGSVLRENPKMAPMGDSQ